MNLALQKKLNYILTALVTIAAFCTVVYQYTSPEHLYWDENYHIASAQKYLNRIFFMEPHPPLGKLLIAAGEALVDANPNDTSFTATDHGKTLPKDFSFAGYRLFPVLLTALSIPLFFIFLLGVSGRALPAFVFALALALDNAFVVHGRAAMLDGIQIFFIIGALTGTIFMYRRLQSATPLKSLPYLTGIALGGALSVKATSLIALPFFALLLVPLWPHLARALSLALKVAGSALVAYLLSWKVHIELGRSVEPALPDRGFYQASEETKQIISGGDVSDATAFWPLLRDHLKFFSHYEKGVPKLNLCNQNENGSSPLLWPIGGRTINYRWDRKDGATRYTYLVVNPVVWALGLISLISAAALFIASLLGRCEMRPEWKLLAGTLLLLWIGYMGAMVSLNRVMYLYHYFIPLTFTLALGALTLPEVRLPSFRWRPPPSVFYALTALVILLGFRYYAPLTYGYPLTNAELASRALLDVWDLRCPDCELTNHLARPVCNPKEKRFPQVRIDSLFATESYQEWGEPMQGLSVEKQQVVVDGKKYDSVIGTHATSTLRFAINKRFTSLRGKAALPDYLKTKSGKPASVVFEIWVDGVQIWASRRLTPNDQVQDFELPVVGGSLLELRTLDGGDGNNNDHAVWLDTHLG
jgi:dolichyl-phosphate-mannose-protein mannosyltransferase